MMIPILLLLLLLQETLKQTALQVKIIIVPYEGEGERLEIHCFSMNTIILKYIAVLPLIYYITKKKAEKLSTKILQYCIPKPALTFKHYVHTNK